MIPRPFEYDKPKPKAEEPPPETVLVDATIIEIQFPGDKNLQIVLFDGDQYEIASDVILIEYKENPRLGRREQKVMIFRSQALYITEWRSKVEVRVQEYRPESAMQPSAAPSDPRRE